MFKGSTLERAIEREQAEEKPLVLSIRQMLAIRQLAEYQVTVSERWEDWEGIMQRIDLVTVGPVRATKAALARAVSRVEAEPSEVPDLRETIARDIEAEAEAVRRHGDERPKGGNG